jgi:hypothetical protein
MLQSIINPTGFPGLHKFMVESEFYEHNTAVSRPEYDYAPHLLLDTTDGRYHLRFGGNWPPGGDHILHAVSSTGGPNSWTLRNTPDATPGIHEGHPGTWYAGNLNDPEIVRVDDRYYMFTEVQISKPDPLDTGEPVVELNRFAWTESFGVGWLSGWFRGLFVTTFQVVRACQVISNLQVVRARTIIRAGQVALIGQVVRAVMLC